MSDSALPQTRTFESVPKAGSTMGLAVRLCLGFLMVMIAISLLAPLISPYGYAEQNLLKRLRPPIFLGGDWAYPLGTDNLGRDQLSRLFFGIRSSIAVALAGTLIGATFGTLLGVIAARGRGLIEEAIMMLVDIQAAVPAFFIAIGCIAFFGNSLAIFILLVSLEGWERYTKLVRALVLSEHGKPYVTAMRAIGASRFQIDLRHVLPNIIASLVVQATITFPWTILLETSLSFLGLGIQPPATSLGQMLGAGRQYLLQAPWLALAPGFAIFFTTLSMSLFGDWLRDRLDPSLKQD